MPLSCTSISSLNNLPSEIIIKIYSYIVYIFKNLFATNINGFPLNNQHHTFKYNVPLCTTWHSPLRVDQEEVHTRNPIKCFFFTEKEKLLYVMTKIWFYIDISSCLVSGQSTKRGEGKPVRGCLLGKKPFIFYFYLY